MSQPASEGALGELHTIVASVLKTRLNDKDLCTAADINAAIKFLKDNNISATREASKELGDLEDELKQVSAEDMSEADRLELEAALENVLQFPGSVANA